MYGNIRVPRSVSFTSFKTMIETKRLILRPFTSEDYLFANNLMNPEFMVFSPSGALSEWQAKNRFNELVSTYQKHNFGKLAVVEKESNGIIGYCGIEPCVVDGISERELGFRLLTEFRGRGYATEVAMAVLSFEVTKGLSNIIAFTEPVNHLSIKVLNKLGFVSYGKSVFSGMPVILFKKIM